MSERRATVRQEFNRPAECRSLARRTDLRAGVVRDLATSGISLLLDRCFEKGDLLTVHLESRTGVLPLILLVRVVHVQRQDDQRWLIGGQFVEPITQAELEDVV